MVKDWSLDLNSAGLFKEYSDTDAIILAIRNIILSKPGNYPLTPALGCYIQQYQFDILDDVTIKNVQSDINKQISQYIPNSSNVEVKVEKVYDENTDKYALGIYIGASFSGVYREMGLLVTKTHDVVDIYGQEMPNFSNTMRSSNQK